LTTAAVIDHMAVFKGPYFVKFRDFDMGGKKISLSDGFKAYKLLKTKYLVETAGVGLLRRIENT
jgi:hypothetical protein